MSSYCAPCLADLALVREAVTTVSGTAACVAHAVLLTHPGDTPQRRLTRLSDLRAMAESKLLTASPEDVPAIELLVQEYALAGAMDMTVPLKDLAGDRTPRPPKPRRNRGRDRERGPGQGPDRGPRPTEGETPAPAHPELTVEAAAEASAAVQLTEAAPDVAAPVAHPELTVEAAVEAAASAPAPAPEAPAPAPEAPASAPEAPVAE